MGRGELQSSSRIHCKEICACGGDRSCVTEWPPKENLHPQSRFYLLRTARLEVDVLIRSQRPAVVARIWLSLPRHIAPACRAHSTRQAASIAFTPAPGRPLLRRPSPHLSADSSSSPTRWTLLTILGWDSTTDTITITRLLRILQPLASDISHQRQLKTMLL